MFNKVQAWKWHAFEEHLRFLLDELFLFVFDLVDVDWVVFLHEPGLFLVFL